MGQETKKQIFDPYFTTKDVGKGTGMGLSVVHGIIKDHKGFVNVESRPGKGSTFYVYFPALPEEISFSEYPEPIDSNKNSDQFRGNFF